MSEKVKRIVAGILLLIFTAYYVNVAFFTHSHIINGVTIVHSHFHTKAHTQTGTHSGSELTLISALSAFQSLPAAPSYIVSGFFALLLAIILISSGEKITPATAACVSWRAPPFFVA